MPPTFLYSGRPQAGSPRPSEHLTSDLVSRGARSDGSLVKAKLASVSPADVLLQPIFNPVGGYASCPVTAARHAPKTENTRSTTAIAVIGIDIGKNSFHVVGHDARGAIVLTGLPKQEKR